jgi:hypothetical protein
VTNLDATRDWYRRAAVELGGTSPLQVSWALGVADDDELLGLIAGLPREHRQPSLLFAVAGFGGAPAAAYPQWRAFVVGHWGVLAPMVAARRTQTNEVGRCIPLLLGLSRFDGPIALLEIGASAGLCLAVDRYSYRFDDGPVLAAATGAGAPLLSASTSGGSGSSASRVPHQKDSPSGAEGAASVDRLDAPPSRMPDIVWRAGIDLAPLDVRDADDVRWLEALLPPDRPERLARLRGAIAAVAFADPADSPTVFAGDALEALAEVASSAPRDATLVVASLGTMAYLSAAARAAIPDAAAALGAHLVAFEPTAAVPGVAERLEHLVAPDPTPFVLSVDGRPIAHGSAHGDRISWLSARHPDLPGSPA